MNCICLYIVIFIPQMAHTRSGVGGDPNNNNNNNNPPPPNPPQMTMEQLVAMQT